MKMTIYDKRDKHEVFEEWSTAVTCQSEGMWLVFANEKTLYTI